MRVLRAADWKGYIAFILSMTALFFIYDYHQILQKRPQSEHQWRQCDGSSIALNYAENGLNFFLPAAHNQHGEEGKVVAEFPVIYYLDGLLISTFGHADFVIRAVNLLFFYLGLFYLFKLGVLIFRNEWLALLPVILMHSFPVASYYAATSLPDFPAIALCTMGIYFLGRYLTNSWNTNLFMTVLIFSLAGMLKPTSLIPFCALIGVLWVSWLVFRKQNRIHLKELLILLIPLAATAIWIYWAKQYNAANDNYTFLQGIKPIWAMDAASIKMTANRMVNDWLPDYSYIPTLILVILMGLAFVVKPSKAGLPFRSGMLLLTIGSVAYLLLFFEQFYHHDYYFIELYPFLIAAFMGGLYTLSRTELGDAVKFPILLTIVIILSLNVFHTTKVMEIRYTDDLQYHTHNDDYFDLEPKLDAAGITKDNLVIASADNSPNISLYLMNRKGFTRFPFGMAQEQIDWYIGKGANYVIHDTDNPDQLDNFTPYLKELLIEHKTLQVWSLQMH
ncbi:MAG: glycosyltransferase family 39 protein [Gammaproteobacteria bacterium]|nr:glycosyltransferase family 39 protein [Gammaproteobacteria bacterium]